MVSEPGGRHGANSSRPGRIGSNDLESRVFPADCRPAAAEAGRGRPLRLRAGFRSGGGRRLRAFRRGSALPVPADRRHGAGVRTVRRVPGDGNLARDNFIYNVLNSNICI